MSISSQMSAEEIEKRSRIQKRGRFSDPLNAKSLDVNDESSNLMELSGAKETTQLVVTSNIVPKREETDDSLTVDGEPIQLTLFDFLKA